METQGSHRKTRTFPKDQMDAFMEEAKRESTEDTSTKLEIPLGSFPKENGRSEALDLLHTALKEVQDRYRLTEEIEQNGSSNERKFVKRVNEFIKFFKREVFQWLAVQGRVTQDAFKAGDPWKNQRVEWEEK